MKKFISIFLALCLSLGVFTVAVSAEQTRLEKYVNDLNNADIIHFSIPDEYVNEVMGIDGITFKDVEIAIKLNKSAEDWEIAIRTKVSIFTCHLIVSPDRTVLYVPTLLCRIDLNKLYGDGSAYSTFTTLLSSSDALPDNLLEPPFLNLESTSTETVDGYGELYCETYTIDLKKAVEDMVASGGITLEEGVVIDDMTEEELVELLHSSGLDEETVKFFLSTTKVYFDGDDFAGMIITSNGQELLNFFNGDPVTVSLSKGEELFKKPFTLFDLSWLFPLFISLF